jgi:ATP-dependent Clp protease, protease subunit
VSGDLVTMFRLQSSADEVELDIYDTIGGDYYSDGVTAKSVMAQLREMPAAREIKLRINSPGGRITEGMAIYSLIQERKRNGARCTVSIDGIAASMASLLAMLGDEIRIAQGGFVMIHNPRGAVMGDANDLRKGAELLDKIRETVVDIYASRTKRSKKEIGEWMDGETWMTAAEALERGFATEVMVDMQAAACADLLSAAGAPEQVMRAAKPTQRAGAPAKEGKTMGISPLVLGALNMTADANETQVAAAITQLRGREALLSTVEASVGANGPAIVGRIAALQESAAEAAELRGRLQEAEKAQAKATVAAILDKAEMAGQLTPARREKAQTMFDRFGMEALQVYMSDLPQAPARPEQRGAADESTGSVAVSESEMRVYASMGYTKDQARELHAKALKAEREAV